MKPAVDTIAALTGCTRELADYDDAGWAGAAAVRPDGKPDEKY